MSDVEILIGEPIEHGSDRALFEHVLGILAEQRLPAIVLANVHLHGRQIDIVLALERLTLVFEAKGNTTAVRGGVNGPWRVRVASGTWKTIDNLYAQTLAARHAVRDAMREFSGTTPPYPSAALVFTPAIPQGSEVAVTSRSRSSDSMTSARS